MKITPRQPISVKISSHTGICTHKPQSAHTLQRKLGLCSRTLRLSTSLARSAPLSFITAVRWSSAIQRFVKNEYKSQEKSKSPTQTLSVLTAGLARYFAANKTSAAPLNNTCYIGTIMFSNVIQHVRFVRVGQWAL